MAKKRKAPPPPPATIKQQNNARYLRHVEEMTTLARKSGVPFSSLMMDAIQRWKMAARHHLRRLAAL